MHLQLPPQTGRVTQKSLFPKNPKKRALWHGLWSVTLFLHQPFLLFSLVRNTTFTLAFSLCLYRSHSLLYFLSGEW